MARPSSAPPVIEMERVTFRYPQTETPTLTEVSLRVEPGEFLGIVGPTGSGKTTLLYLMAGIIPHYFHGQIEGRITIDGLPTTGLSLARLTERVGVVLQDPEAQLFNLLVRDELAWGLENRGRSRESIAQDVADTVSFFHLEHLQDRITYDLSGGEKQRVALAAVHALAPQVFLFDNPTSQLDPLGAADVLESIRQVANTHGFSIVLVEDKVDELVRVADRMVLLDRGRITLDAAPREFCLSSEPLARAGIRSTQIAELSAELVAAAVQFAMPVPITVEEAVLVLRPLLTGA
jgi:energy-coupling factor transporter ATP-binding protein EcfA2